MKVPKEMEKHLSQEYAQYLRDLVEEAGRVDAGRQVPGEKNSVIQNNLRIAMEHA